MSSDWFALNEREFRSQYVYVAHENKLYRRMTQPSENMIYEENARLQGEQQRKLSFGRYVGQVPNVLLEAWRRRYPEMRCWDKEIRERKLMELLRQNPQCLTVPKSKL